MSEKYSKMNHVAAFGFLANAIGGGGDAGRSFPQSDAEDLSCGARFIPGEVTMARRRGGRVYFEHSAENPSDWYWELPDGKRINHYVGEATSE